MADEKRVRKLFQSGTITDNPLTDSATTINFAAAPGFATLAADEHIAIVLDPLGVDGAPEVVYITDYTAAATSATIARAQEGTTARAHNTGTAWLHGPTVRDQASGRVAFKTRTSGDITGLASSTWIDLDTGTDLTIKAQAGDIIEVGVSIGWINTAIYKFLDAVSLVSGSPVTSWATGAAPNNSYEGVPCWTGLTGVFLGQGGSVMRAADAGDIAGGTITLRLRYRGSASTSTQVAASTAKPLHVWAKNHGPQEA